MSSPKISVIFPFYNTEKYLCEAVDSVLAQTHGDFEMICVDDGSTDRSFEIMNSYNDSRIRIFQQENGGPHAAYNTALSLAEGLYIAVMDSDDVCKEHRFEMQADFLDDHPNIGVVGSYPEFIDSKGNVSGSWAIPTSTSWVKRRLLAYPSLIHPTTMYRREIYDALGGYPEMRYAEDYAYWTRIALHFDLANIPEVLLSHRWHEHNVSNEHSETQIENHRKIRRSYWEHLPDQPNDFEQIQKELKSLITEEMDNLNGVHHKKRLIKQLIEDNIGQAHLAFGAQREDVGMRCLVELSQISDRSLWNNALGVCADYGFDDAWSMVMEASPEIVDSLGALYRW